MPKSTITPETTYPMRLPDGTLYQHLVFLKNVINQENFQVGDWTYYHDKRNINDYASVLAPYLFPNSPEKLLIGKFVQIAQGVQFITSGANHPFASFSNYPFFIFGLPWSDLHHPQENLHRDTYIGHDVWIGHEAIIMPGVHIGNGAIIGARSVVTKNVDPYTIVAGNPAQNIRKRFPEATIKSLLDLAWWDWPISKIERSMKAISEGDLQELAKSMTL